MLLDLDALDPLEAGCGCSRSTASTSSPFATATMATICPAARDRRQHHPEAGILPERSARSAADDAAAARLRLQPDQHLFLLTRLRSRWRRSLYEVDNTFGERHAYMLPVDGEGPRSARCDKRFHVSPFMAMDMRYAFRRAPPGERAR